MFDPFTLGLGALEVGSGVFGLFNRSGRVNQGDATMSNALELQQSLLEQQRMNLDANRRKRDIIRQAQVATANAEASASNSGALNSSGIEGARAGISGQAGVNYLGVSQNQEIGNQMFTLQRLQSGIRNKMQSQSVRRTTPVEAVGGLINGKEEELSRLLRWGFNFK